MNFEIKNIRRRETTGEIHADLRNGDTGELLVSATLDYIAEWLQRNETVRVVRPGTKVSR